MKRSHSILSKLTLAAAAVSASFIAPGALAGAADAARIDTNEPALLQSMNPSSELMPLIEEQFELDTLREALIGNLARVSVNAQGGSYSALATADAADATPAAELESEKALVFFGTPAVAEALENVSVSEIIKLADIRIELPADTQALAQDFFGETAATPKQAESELGSSNRNYYAARNIAVSGVSHGLSDRDLFGPVIRNAFVYRYQNTSDVNVLDKDAVADEIVTGGSLADSDTTPSNTVTTPSYRPALRTMSLYSVSAASTTSDDTDTGVDIKENKTVDSLSGEYNLYEGAYLNQDATWSLSGVTFDIKQQDTTKFAWIYSGKNGGTPPRNIDQSLSGLTLKGTGDFGVAISTGSNGTVSTITLTGIEASEFVGRVLAVNNFANATNISLAGNELQYAEYMFGTIATDAEGTYGIKSGVTSATYTLNFTDSATLAGISGTTDRAGQEKITASATGYTLTLTGGSADYKGYSAYTDDGTPTFVYNGAFGASGTPIGLTVSGGNQTLGGAAYISNLTVSGGTLKFGGTTNVAGTFSVSGEDSSLVLLDNAVVTVDGVTSQTSFDFSKLSGAESSRVKINASSTAGSFTSITALSSDFEGSIEVASGYLRINDVDLESELDNVKSIVLSGGSESGICTVQAGNALEISADIVAEGNGGALRSYGLNSYGAIFSGNVSGTTIRHWDGGTHTFTGAVDLATFNAQAGITTFSGDSTSITTLNVSGGTTNVSGTGTTSITNLNISGGSAVNLNSSSWSVDGATKTNINFNRNGSLTFGNVSDATETIYNVGGIDLTSDNDTNYYQRFLTIDSGVTVNATSLSNSWGMGSLTVNGVLSFSEGLRFSTGDNNSTTNNIITGTGVIRMNTLTLGNAGTYNINGGIRLEIGSGGIVRNIDSNTWGNARNLGDATLAVTETWTSSVGSGHTFNLTDVALGTTIEVAAEQSATFDGAFSGIGKFNKTGTGTLTLAGGYSAGAIDVQEGTLKLGGTIVLNDTISNAGTVEFASGASLNLGNLVFSEVVNDEGNLVRTYQVISGEGEFSGFEATFVSGYLSGGRGDSSVDLNENGSVVVTTTAKELTWAGGASGGVWNKANTNWDKTPNDSTDANEAFFAGDSVIFAGDADVSVGEAVSVGNLTVKSGTVSFSYSNNSTITANRIIVEDGTLDLNAGGGQDSSLRGAITINNGGTVKLTTGDATGWGGGSGISIREILVNTGGKLVINDSGLANQTFSNMELILNGGEVTHGEGSGQTFDLFNNGSSITAKGGTADNILTSTISTGFNLRQNDTKITVEEYGKLVVSGSIGNGDVGNHNMIKLGAGTLELTGANTYTGSTTISEGTLMVSRTGTLGSGNISIKNGAVLSVSAGTPAASYDFSKVSSEKDGRLKLKASSTDGDEGYTAINALSSEFKGSLEITGGYLRVNTQDLADKLDGVASIILSGGNNSGICTIGSPSSTKISANIVAEGNGGYLRTWGSNDWGATFTGKISGTTLTHNDGGTHTFTGAVDLTTFNANAGVTTFSGESTFNRLNVTAGTTNLVGTNITIGEGATGPDGNTLRLSVSGSGTANIGDGTTQTVVNVGELFTSDSAWSGPNTLNVKANATLNITGTSNVDNDSRNSSVLLGHWVGRSDVNVDGTFNSVGAKIYMGFTSGYTASVKINNGGTVNALGIGATTWGSRGTSEITMDAGGKLNLGTGGILANTSVTLNGGTLGAYGNWSSSNAMAVNGAVTVNTAHYNVDTATTTDSGHTITLSGILSGGGSLTKEGAGTLVLSGANTYTGGTIVKAGTLQINNQNPVGTFELQGGTLYLTGTPAISVGGTLAVTGDTQLRVAETGSVDVTLQEVNLANEKALTVYSDKKAVKSVIFKTLSVAGERVSLKTQHHAGHLVVNRIDRADEVSSATLNLVNTSNSSITTLFKLGNSDITEVGDFIGTINLSSTDSGDKRSASVIIGNETIAQNAVINLSSATSATAVLSLGVNAETVKIAGLKSTLGDSKAVLYSGTFGTEKPWAESDIQSGDTVRTLEINVAGTASYEFNGKVIGSSLNLVKTGSGTQTFSGTSTFKDITVSAGNLTFTNAALSTTTFLEGSKMVVSGGSVVFGSNASTMTNASFGENLSLEISGSGNVSLRLAQNADKEFKGNIALKNGATLQKWDGGIKITGNVSLGENTTDTTYINACWQKNAGLEIAGTLSGLGTTYIDYSNDNESGGTEVFSISGSKNTYSGTLVIGEKSGDGDKVELRLNKAGAATYATINLAGGSKASMTVVDGVTIAGLDGTAGSTVTTSETDTATFTVNGGGTFAGTITGSLNLVKGGSGTQTFSGTSTFNNVDVKAGTLELGGKTTVSVALTVANGADLKIASQGVSAGSVTLAHGAEIVVDLADFDISNDSVTLTVLKTGSLYLPTTEAVALSLAAETAKDYSNLSEYCRIKDEAGAYSQYTNRVWAYENGELTLTLAIPEPTTFGFLSGLAALVFVGGRRRKRKTC